MKRTLSKIGLIVLLPIVTLGSCGLIAIIGGVNGAPFVLVFSDGDVAVTNGGTLTIPNGASVTLTVRAQDPDGDFVTLQ